jgi:hypothetical protein
MEQIKEMFLNIHSNIPFESIKTFSNSRDEIFSKEGFFFPDHFNSHSRDFNDSYNVNSSIFFGNSPKNYDNILDINENEENVSNIQQNNSKRKIENKNNNSTTIKTPFLSQKTLSQSNSNKEKKHLGRKTNEEKANQIEDSSHDMYREDNMLKKIQNHYLNFIIALLNIILPHFNYNKKLYKLDYKFKNNITKENVESLKKETIGNIISNQISEKYTSIYDKINANKNIYEEIKDNPKLNKILSEKYLVFFKKFYYNSGSFINLKDYGLDKDINFTKDVKNFKHFLKENEKRGTKYIKLIKRLVFKKYLPGSIFTCSK